MFQIEVDKSTAEAIREAAKVRNISVAEYVRLIVLVVERKTTPAEFDPADFDAQLDELLINAPSSLPSDFSRTDIYSDHD